MDTVEKNDLDSQMTILQDVATEEAAEVIKDEAEDLRNSLQEIVQDKSVKPKLHCLMMDPDFSMVTVQCEDSGIVWETASSRCSTPWASEFSSVIPEPSLSLVPKHSGMPGSETAGRIIFIMDEDSMIRRKKRIRNKAEQKVTQQVTLPDDVPDRPAMVEVSLPNMKPEEQNKVEEDANPKEEGNQRLFCLVSEGSEILNIIVPPKVSTVDEEESQELMDNLSYLEDTPIIKHSDVTEDQGTSAEDQMGNPEQFQAIIPAKPEPLALLPPPIKPARRGATSEDYFEKFTLLDHQASVEVHAEDVPHEPEGSTAHGAEESLDQAADANPTSVVSDDSASVSGLDIASEHVDEVFYGGGSDPESRSLSMDSANAEVSLLKSPLKESGAALFGSQESILTPIFLPEGPPKIIDLVLLEEPKAMAFMYSDLYADAVGSRMKQDDTESLRSEKSFHSQDSDSEARGYLEKFVLKDETPMTSVDPLSDNPKEERVKMWSQDAFGGTHHQKNEAGALEDEDDVTDFFRNSGSSSPCEPIQLLPEEPEEPLRELSKTRCVTFKNEPAKETKGMTEAGNNMLQPPEEDDIEIAEAFLPLDISDEPVTMGTWWETGTAENTRPSQLRRSAGVPPHKKVPPSTKAPPEVKSKSPCQKSFLDLTPLLPAASPDEAETPDVAEGRGGAAERGQAANGVGLSTAKTQESIEEALDYELISKPETREPGLDERGSATDEGSDHSGGFTMVDHPSQLDDLCNAVEADFEIVDAPVL